MTALRQKMIEDMQLRGLSERTQETYIRVVRQLAEYYRKPPDQLSQKNCGSISSTSRMTNMLRAVPAPRLCPV